MNCSLILWRKCLFGLLSLLAWTVQVEQRHSHFSFFSHSFPWFDCISPGLLLSHFGNRGQGFDLEPSPGCLYCKLMKVCLRNKVDFRSSLSGKNLFTLLCIDNTDMKHRWTHKTWMRWESQRYFSRSYLSAICFLRAFDISILHTCYKIVAANSNKFSWIGSMIFSSYPRQPSRSTFPAQRLLFLVRSRY